MGADTQPNSQQLDDFASKVAEVLKTKQNHVIAWVGNGISIADTEMSGWKERRNIFR